MQPFGYNSLLAKVIKTRLSEKYPNKTFKIKRNYTKNQADSINTYFIINDPSLKTWDGLKISQKIRLNEPKAILILVSTELDYIKFFRSHIGFFGIIDLKHTNSAEIESYLDDTIQLNHLQNT